jgi:hypothetical protein
MDDWVTHPSSTAARKILVIYQLSEEGSPEPLGIRKNKPTERSGLGREDQNHHAAAFPSNLRFLLLSLFPEEDF